ncbi:hypothetical protein HYALB_00011537 [Hymenoscyphus albidus]|uniref:C2H2-type domain-containing protein n=1 Tax=Hymenoscyphus albidus TaxID=595503 RepID=A0A9N9LP01_9HELO|nr:hypothetical protein HYALB_00011537 [Hymenoscyphus albidus]
MSIRRGRRRGIDLNYDLEEEREQQLSKTQHFNPIVSPTQTQYKRLLELWKEFKDSSSCLREKEELPKIGRLKLFMECFFKTSVGLLEANITLKSLLNAWGLFRSAYQRATFNVIPQETADGVRMYIKTVLRDEGLTLVRRQKYLADQLDVTALLQFLWCFDTYQFSHPRERLQLSFILLLIIYTGSRAGAIVESSAYTGSYEALCYKDFELIGVRSQTGGMKLLLKVLFRYEKGKRNDESKGQKWVTFHEDVECPGRCPIAHFLGLAFADNVFISLEKPSDLRDLYVPSHKHSITFPFTDTKKDLLIFRNCTTNGVIHSKPMTYNKLARYLGDLGDVSISTNEYSQLLGHSTKVMGAFYISNISGIDGQSILNNQTQRKDHIQQLRGMSLNLNLYASVINLTTDDNQSIMNNPEYSQALADEEAIKTTLLESPPPGAVDLLELNESYTKATAQRKNRYRRLQNKTERDRRSRSFQQADISEVQEQIKNRELGLKPVSEHEFDQPKEFQFISADYFPQQHAIAQAQWGSLVRTDRDIKLLENLCFISKPESFTTYYPGESPSNGCCPVCDIGIDTIHYLNRAGLPLHACGKIAKMTSAPRKDFYHRGLQTIYPIHWKEKLQEHMNQRSFVIRGVEANPNFHPFHGHWQECNLWCDSEIDLQRHLFSTHRVDIKQAAFIPQFCFQHPACGWFLDEINWENHCELHLEKAPKSCKLEKTASGTIIAGIQCPLCIGDESKPASKRFTQFIDIGTFNRHLDFHEKKWENPTVCRIPACKSMQFTDFTQLQVPFFDCHSLSPKGYTLARGLCSPPEEEKDDKKEDDRDKSSEEDQSALWGSSDPECDNILGSVGFLGKNKKRQRGVSGPDKPQKKSR